MNKKRRARSGQKPRRSKAKKPKFLSLLRLQFPAEDGKCALGENQTSGGSLNLFPLCPENQVPDCCRENQDQENVAYFFSAADGGATTLTGILDDAATAPSISSSHTTNNNNNNTTYYNNRQEDDLSPSSAYAYRRQECKDGAAIVRNAMRNRERDSSEEKWVCYSEVVERKVKEEEVSSSSCARDSSSSSSGHRLCLKLDYQQILNAWSNKGPLYVDTEDNSQIVPDITCDDLLVESSLNAGGMGCNKMRLWMVPEMVDKIGQREASVLRYKEKRRNRLFSKKIRYQVRKLNAEKRPRLKGRFVKRS